MSRSVALVTGGSRGIGRGVCRAFAALGYAVVVASRKADDCRATAEQLAADHDVPTLAVPTNVSDWDACDDLVDAAYSTYGRVDVLVNNAGMSPRYDSLVDVDSRLWDKVIGVNLRGPFRLGAAIGTRMAAGEGGSIVNIGSVAAELPTPHALPYAAAKAGLHALTVGFAQAFAPKVRVNTVHPGPIRTDIATAWDRAETGRLEQSVALRRLGTVEEIVAAVVYFGTAASSYTTGAALRIDGGMS